VAAINSPGDGLGAPTRRRLAGFVHTLRDNGFKLGLAETGDALEILASPLASRPSTLKPALRSLFCATHSDWERFDEIFDAFWLGQGVRQARTLAGSALAGRARAGLVKDVAQRGEKRGLPDQSGRRHEGGASAGDGRGQGEGASRPEILAGVDLPHIVAPADIAQAHALAARLSRV